VYCLEAGDVAVGRSEWSIRDGNKTKVEAKGIELLKRQPDGTWKVLIDHAFGAEANLIAG
jgi:ketosteroid isomerase-like protein